MVSITENELLAELVAEAARSQRQPGDITVAEYRDALCDAGIVINHRNAYDRLQRKVLDGTLQKVILGKLIVYRKVAK